MLLECSVHRVAFCLHFGDFCLGSTLSCVRTFVQGNHRILELPLVVQDGPSKHHVHLLNVRDGNTQLKN